jgi:hypothetical protein
MTEKTHFRKAFDSPYLSSSDLVEPVTLTVKEVRLEADKSKRTKDKFNTMYFVESEIRKGEPLKPMILNAGNSKIMKSLTNTPFIEDWAKTKVTIYVEHNVKFGKETMDGLRISPNKPQGKSLLTPDLTKNWENAKQAYLRDGNLTKVLERVDMSQEHQLQLKKECEAV